MNGYLMAMKSDGTPTPLGKVVEINTILQTPELPPVRITTDTELTFKVTLTKKNKKEWAKILNMPKFALTEWIFPRKKKRGTKRRIRKAERQALKVYGLNGETGV